MAEKALDEGKKNNPVKTEFHQIPSIDEIPWNSMEFSMEFHQPQFHNSMEFHGKFHGIQFHEFHGIPWKTPWNFPWNSMENFNGKNPSNVYEKFHGIRIPLNSMEFEFH
jgi:hypothetical protein